VQASLIPPLRQAVRQGWQRQAPRDREAPAAWASARTESQGLVLAERLIPSRNLGLTLEYVAGLRRSLRAGFLVGPSDQAGLAGHREGTDDGQHRGYGQRRAPTGYPVHVVFRQCVNTAGYAPPRSKPSMTGAPGKTAFFSSASAAPPPAGAGLAAPARASSPPWPPPSPQPGGGERRKGKGRRRRRSQGRFVTTTSSNQVNHCIDHFESARLQGDHRPDGTGPARRAHLLGPPDAHRRS
jgi:hypothetical protein